MDRRSGGVALTLIVAHPDHLLEAIRDVPFADRLPIRPSVARETVSRGAGSWSSEEAPPPSWPARPGPLGRPLVLCHGPAMISQGELLELLADSDQHWQRLHAQCVLRLPARVPSGLRRGAPGATPGPKDLGPEVTFDVAATTGPFRLRVERVLGAQPVDVPDLAVDDGTALWMQTGVDVQQSRFRAPTDRWVAAVSDLLVPRGLSAEHRLRVVGDGEVAGRPCWRVRAMAVLDPPPVRDSEGDLLVDQQTGLVLSQVWRRQGAPISSAEMTRLDIDGPAQPELFMFTPPPGTGVTPGMPVQLPTRYRPAIIVGLLTAVAGDAVARVAGALGSRRQK